MRIEPDHHRQDHTHDDRHDDRPLTADTERVVHRLWQFLDGQVDLDLATVYGLAQTLARSATRSRSSGSEATDGTDGADGMDQRTTERYPIDRYGDRDYQVSDGSMLIAVTVYRKGALEVRRQLRQRDQRISDLEAVLAALLAALAHPDPDS